LESVVPLIQKLREHCRISNFFLIVIFNHRSWINQIKNTLPFNLFCKKVKINSLKESCTYKTFNNRTSCKITIINSLLEKESTINLLISNLIWAKYLKSLKVINPQVYKDKIKLKSFKKNSILLMNPLKMLLQFNQKLINNLKKSPNFSLNILKLPQLLEWKKLEK